MGSQPRWDPSGQDEKENTILAKPIEGQNEDRTTLRFNIDQSSPQKGYNSQCVIFLIWLSALCLLVDLTVDVYMLAEWT